MKLKWLQQDTCPVCGCPTIVKEWVETYNMEVKTHCMGGEFEHREFLCGQEIKNWANSHDIMLCEYSICRNNEEYKLKQKKREDAKKAVINFIGTLDIPEKLIEYWKSQAKYW